VRRFNARGIGPSQIPYRLAAQVAFETSAAPS
jgi:hypothetical protein